MIATSQLWQPEDTARLTAAFRVLESERHAPLVSDSWAAELAGERGKSLLRQFPTPRESSNGSVVRTWLIDQVIQKMVELHDIETVLCLGAGFDTRPYRLPLPKRLRWVEIDLDDVIQHKRSVLRRVASSCKVQRFVVDLLDTERRRAWMGEYLPAYGRTLVVTEGLLVYLMRQEVASIAADLHETGEVLSWITDLGSPFVMEWMDRLTETVPGMEGVLWSFAPANPELDFHRMNWSFGKLYSIIRRADRLGRPLISAKVESEVRASGGDPERLSTVAVLQPFEQSVGCCKKIATVTSVPVAID